MNLHRTITRNALWNWTNLAVAILSGFIVTPILVHRLGETTYGLWIVIISIMNSLTLLDFGLRASIGRYIVFYKARNDAQSLGTLILTARNLMLAAAGGVLLVTLALQYLFGTVFEIPASQIAHVRLAMLLAGASIAITLSLAVYDGMLWAYARFDLISGIDIATTILNACGTIFLLTHGYSVLALTVLLLVTTSLKEVAKMTACLTQGLDRGAASARPSWEVMWRLIRFGLWSLLRTVGVRATGQSVPMIIGARLSPMAVTPFNVASTLTNYARAFVGAGADVVAPVATALHAAAHREAQERHFVDASKYSFALSLLCTIGLVLLGKPFIVLWLGDGLSGAAWLLIVLAVGEILPMSQRIACNVIQAANRHYLLGLAGVAEAVGVIALGLLLARAGGLAAVCLAVALCGLVCRGIIPMVYACRILGLSLRQYALRALSWPLVVAAPPTIGLAFMVYRRPPTNWLELITYALAFSGAFFGLGMLILRRSAIRAPVWTAPTVAESA